MRAPALPVVFGLILLLAALCGCASNPYYPPDGSGRVMVDYHRTGGIAGVNDHLVIYENGTVFITTNAGESTSVLSSYDMDSLNTLFEQARFLDLSHSYPAPSPGADYFTYTITYRGYTVQTEDTGVPPALTPIIRQLNQILSSGCEGGEVCPAF